MYPYHEELAPTQWLGAEVEQPRLGHAGRAAAIALATIVILAAAVGIGLAFAEPGDHGMGAPRTQSAAREATPTAGNPGLSRQDWAHQYGQDRSAMPNMPDVASATPDQRAAAADLLTRTEASTAAYSDVNAAKAAGYDLDGSLARTEARLPRYAQWLQAVDAGRTPPKMPMLHVANKANIHDGKVLDPAAPEVLMYEYQGRGAWKLVGVMYLANEAYPQAPPDPGGPITRWHYHDQAVRIGLMMHMFFVPGNDLARAYALTMDGM
jgi:hypothetical protein